MFKNAPRPSYVRAGAAAALIGVALVGGLRPTEGWLVLAFVAAGVSALIPRGRQDDDPPPVVDVVLVGVLTLGFVVLASGLYDPDRPLGTDWMAYLKNAVAVGTGEWGGYQRWRGPMHAWLTVALVPLTGGLVAASQTLSLLACTAAIPLTWWIGRALIGRVAGLVAAGLVVGWADLRLHAVSSTPYALLMVLQLAGLALSLASARRPWMAAPAGIVFALAIATDLRAQVTVGLLLIGTMLPGNPQTEASGRRPIYTALLAGLIAGAGSVAILATLPFALVPLQEQLVLQRELNAREGSAECAPRGKALPTVPELLGPCGQSNVRTNLQRGQSAAPVDLGVIAALLGIGLVAVGRWRPRWVLAAPILPTLASLAVVGIQPRYIVPLAPFVALGVGAALAWIGGGASGRPARILGTVAVAGMGLAFADGWSRWPGGLWALANGGGDIDPALSLHGPALYGTLAATLRAQLVEDDHILDCAHAALDVRLYPHPVEVLPPGSPSRLSKACATVLERGVPHPATTWLVVTLDDRSVKNEAWQSVYSAPRGAGGQMPVPPGETGAGQRVFLLRQTGGATR